MTATPHSDNQLARLDAHKIAVEQAMQEAVNDAILTHQRLGLPMVEWQDDRVVWVPAEELSINEDDATH